MAAALDAQGWDYPQPYIYEMTVEAQDIDRLDHANNAAYLRWMERAGWQHTNALGLTWDDYVRIGVSAVVRRHELDYLAATYAGERLAVATWVTDNDNRLSLWRAFQIRRSGDGKTVLRAKTHYVCMRLDSGRACRMPEQFRQAYAVPDWMPDE